MHCCISGQQKARNVLILINALPSYYSPLLFFSTHYTNSSYKCFPVITYLYPYHDYRQLTLVDHKVDLIFTHLTDADIHSIHSMSNVVSDGGLPQFTKQLFSRLVCNHKNISTFDAVGKRENGELVANGKLFKMLHRLYDPYYSMLLLSTSILSFFTHSSTSASYAVYAAACSWRQWTASG